MPKYKLERAAVEVVEYVRIYSMHRATAYRATHTDQRLYDEMMGTTPPEFMELWRQAEEIRGAMWRK